MNREISRRQVARMRRDWDRRARENARYYVATGRQDWSDAEFFAAGEQELRDHVYNDRENICRGRQPADMRVLEIGCGAGRVTRPLAGYFGEVYAVDISRHMVRQARRAVADFPNAHVFRNNGRDLACLRQPWWRAFGRRAPLEFDFAFSCLVFQHIASRAVIASYVREVNRFLRAGALFKFQVQGFTAEELSPEDSWSGYPFTRKDAEQMAGESGFELRYDWGAGTQYYWLWFFKR